MYVTKMKLVNALIVLALFTNFSCSDNDENDSENAITEDEAVMLVASSLEEESGGSIETIIQLTIDVEITVETNEVCGETFDDGIAYDYDKNGISASYTGDWSYQIQCDESNLPSSATYSYEKALTASTARVSSSGTSKLSGTLEGLNPDVESFYLAGVYKGDYTQQLTVSDKSVTSNLVLNIESLVIDKSTDSITSGEASFTLSGTSNGVSFSYTGTISFKADGSAEVIIDGHTHIILS